jgi:hypothetical protein
MAVLGGLLSAVFFTTGGISLLSARSKEHYANQIVKLPASTLAEAALTAPSRAPHKYPFVKTVSEVKQNATIEVREEWYKSGSDWKRRKVEEIISRFINGKLVLVDDGASPAVKVTVPDNLLSDEVFEVIDEKFEVTIPKEEAPSVSFNLGVSSGLGFLSASLGDDHKPRTLGFRKLEMVIPANRKMFAAGAISKTGGGEGQLILIESPKDKYFTLCIGGEDDFLDREYAQSAPWRKAGYALIGMGGLTAAGTGLLVWLANSNLKSKRK